MKLRLPAWIRATRCTAHSARTGQPCRRWAIYGATVCPSHGGRAPQVRKAAAERVWLMLVTGHREPC
jgi:hypothetical protein